MLISELLKEVKIIKKYNFERAEQINIDNICFDSRNKKECKNSLFVCINGQNFDSHNDILGLESLEVKFFVTEREVNTKTPYVIVNDTREVLSIICNNFYSHPIKNLKLVGVVGTNGKTSTTYFTKKLLELQGKKCGLIGTSGVYIKNRRLEETLTTPDPILLFSLFSKMKKAGCEVIIMEVSAHAIYLKKISGLVFDIAVFTNFSQDHLDFFGTMENYMQTKFSFFKKERVKKAIINIDDDAGEKLFNKIKNEIPCETFSLNKSSNLIAQNVKLYLDKTLFTIKTNSDSFKIKTKTACLFNIYNILASLLVTKNITYNLPIESLSKLKGARGRFETIKLKKAYIIIDYAHTPESLLSVLKNIKQIGQNNIITLFGCPGNRDESKRKIMGEIASKFSKEVIITTDNPKYENPLLICDEILSGAKNGNIIEDREKAVKYGIKKLKENEVLLIVGKGCEKYQDINNLKIKYNDYITVKKCIKRLKKK